MRSLSLLTALTAVVGPAAVSAFENTSPFFIFSPNRLPPSTLHLASLPASHPQSTATFLSAAHAVIAQCAAEAYVLVHQPNLHASHLQAASPPHLRNALRRYKGNHLLLPFVRPAEGIETPGEDAPSVLDTLEHWAHSDCAAETIRVEATTGAFAPFDDMRPKVLRVEFPALGSGGGGGGDGDGKGQGKEMMTEKERMAKIREMDVFLFSVLDLLPTDRFVVVFTSTPAEGAAVVKDKQEKGDEEIKVVEGLMGMPSAAVIGEMMPETELKARSSEGEEMNAEKDKDGHDKDDNGKLPANASLFQRYVFFSPAVWMGYIAAFFMLAIAYVALSALGSLKVSYGAFEKEMAPAAAKKQQ